MAYSEHRDRRGGGRPREEHALYVALGDKSPAGGLAARYLGSAAGALEAQGVTIEICRVRPRDLRDRRVLEAFRRRGIDRLPAVLARGRPLVGLVEIRAYYDAGLGAEPRTGPRAGPREPARFAFAEGSASRRGPGQRPGAAPQPPELPDEDDSPEAFLEDYYRQEMLEGGRGDNEGDSGFGAA